MGMGASGQDSRIKMKCSWLTKVRTMGLNEG